MMVKGRPNIAVSDSVSDVLPHGLIRTLPNPVETFEIEPIPWGRRRYQFLFVGRLTPDKGLDVFLEALAGLSDPPRAAVVGSGPEDRLFKSSSIARLVLDGGLEILGTLTPNEVAHQMADSRWLVAPSRSETFGQVAIEGLSQGCGLIVSQVGGLARYVERCAMGFPAEDISGLRDCMVRSLRFEGFPAMWTGYKDTFLVEHRVDTSADAYLRHFEELMDTTRGPRRR
jgi:glycosyltransferase involved in cell wall biosynthesis